MKSLLVACAMAEAKRPNFVVLFVDDMGYGDLGSFGSKAHATPNLDAMVEHGMKFTQWISAASICTPSRAALMTGRYPIRSGMAHNTIRTFVMPEQPTGLPRDELTFAELLKADGYKTGMAGKWHLGFNKDRPDDAHWAPHSRGFDDFLGYPLSNGRQCGPQTDGVGRVAKMVFGHFMGDPMNTSCMLYQNNTIVQQPMILENKTHELTHHALNFLEDAAKDPNTPFVYLMSWLHVHEPMYASQAFAGKSRGGPYGDNVEEMDWSAGQILLKLQKLNLEQDTLVFFTSDNGPYQEKGWESSGSSGGFRGSKGQTWEGGIRMPGIAYWPGKIAPGVVTDALVNTMDLLPTMLELAKVSVPTKRLDGHSMVSLLLGETTESAHNSMIHYCGTNILAARWGNYKLHFKTQKWTSEKISDSPCNECCPINPNNPVSIGEGVCGCNNWQVSKHKDPVIFDMVADPFERFALTLENFAGYEGVVASARQAVRDHEASLALDSIPSLLTALPKASLRPCMGETCAGYQELPFQWPPASDTFVGPSQTVV